MLRHFRGYHRRHLVDAIDQVRRIQGGVEQIGKAIDKLAFERVVKHERAQEISRGGIVVIVQRVLGPRPVRFEVVGEHVERPRRWHRGETAEPDVIVELQPAPATAGRAGPPQPVVPDVPAVIENLGDLVVDVVGRFHERLHVRVVGRVAHVVRLEELHHRVVLLRVTGARHNVAFEIIEVVGRSVAVVSDEVGVFLFLEVMQSPILAVQENNRQPRGLGLHAELHGETLHELVAHQRQIIVLSRRPQQEVLELRARAFGKNAVAERLAALAAGAIEIKALDGEVLRRVAVNLHPGVLRQGQGAVGLEKLDVHGPFPVVAALGIVAARRVAGHVDADVRVEKICRLGGQRDDRHGVAGTTFDIAEEGARHDRAL